MSVRRNLLLPLLLGLMAVLACGLALFRRIGPWELGVVLIPVALVLAIESVRYIAGRFVRGYRRRPPSG